MYGFKLKMQYELKANKGGYGIASLICSSVGLLLFLAPYFGLPLSILGLVFNNKQRKTNTTGMGIAGSIVGIIGIVLNACALLFIGAMLLFMGGLSRMGLV